VDRELRRFVRSLRGGLRHPAHRRNLEIYVAGLIKATHPKHLTQVISALDLGASEYESVQHFLAHGAWDPSDLLAQIARHAASLGPAALWFRAFQLRGARARARAWRGDALMLVGEQPTPVAWDVHKAGERNLSALFRQVSSEFDGLPLIAPTHHGASESVRDWLDANGKRYAVSIGDVANAHVVFPEPTSGAGAGDVPLSTGGFARTLARITERLAAQRRFPDGQRAGRLILPESIVTTNRDFKRLRKETLLVRRQVRGAREWIACWVSNADAAGKPAQLVALADTELRTQRAIGLTVRSLSDLGLTDYAGTTRRGMAHHCAAVTAALVFARDIQLIDA
jgi:hypothetical protein